MVLQMTRRYLRVAMGFAWLAVSSLSRAQGPEATPKAACFEAHEQGQLQRNSGHLQAARASFLQCSNESCPSLVRKDCLEFAEKVSEAQPTVIVAATDPQGHDTADVRFFVDGVRISDRLTGAPVTLDPGEHLLRFELQGSTPVEERVILREGERDRSVPVTFATRSPVVPASRTFDASAHAVGPRATTSTWVYALAGTSVAALGVFSYFAIAGKSLEKGRAASCSPRCSPAEISPIKRDYVIADIALGIGVVAAATAGWVFLSQGSSPSSQSTGWIDVKSTTGGARLEVGTQF